MAQAHHRRPVNNPFASRGGTTPGGGGSGGSPRSVGYNDPRYHNNNCRASS